MPSLWPMTGNAGTVPDEPDRTTMMWPIVPGETTSDPGFASETTQDVWAEGPAVLRLRMLELKFGLRSHRLTAQARRDTEQAMRDMRQAVLDLPPHSFADLVAKLQTFSENNAEMDAKSDRQRDGSVQRDETIFG